MMSRKKCLVRPLRRSCLPRLENLHFSRSLHFVRLETRRMLSTIVQTETNAQGTLYTLSDAASGGWLEMRPAGSVVTQVIDTNVSRFGIDASGAAVALEDTGNLVLFAAGSASGSLMLRSVRNFVVDGDGEVTALQAVSGTQWGSLVRFIPGTTHGQEYQNEQFKSLDAALGVSIALAADGTLRYFPDDSNDAIEMVRGGDVTNFVVDDDGSVVALVKSSQGATAGNLVRWSADGAAPTTIAGSYQALALDGKGDVVALDNSDPAQHLGVVWLFAPGSNTPQQMSPNWTSSSGVVAPYPGTFLVDGSGTVWVFEQAPNTIWFATTYYPGSNSQEALFPSSTAGAYTQFELDGAGSVVAVNYHTDNLVRFAPGGTTEQEMAADVSNFIVDGAGYVVADANGVLIQFAPGEDSSVTIDTGVTSMALDGTGAVVALNSGGQLDRFAPGSSVAQALDPNNRYVSFAISSAGFVVALSSTGELVQFLPQTSADAFERNVMITSGVNSFYIDADGYLIVVDFDPLSSSRPYGGTANPLVIFSFAPDSSNAGGSL